MSWWVSSESSERTMTEIAIAIAKLGYVFSATFVRTEEIREGNGDETRERKSGEQ